MIVRQLPVLKVDEEALGTHVLEAHTLPKDRSPIPAKSQTKLHSHRIMPVSRGLGEWLALGQPGL